MRQKIIDFIKDAPDLPDDRWKYIASLVDSAPDSIIREIYARIMSDVEAVERLTWTQKLKEYIESDPPKYESNKGRLTPSQFLEKVWGEYIDHGVLYQDQLSHYDEKLIPAIYTYWSHYQRADNDRLPLPKSDRVSAIMQRVIAHGPDSPEDVTRAILTYAKRGTRGR